MPIPPLDAPGFLPVGVHDCTLDELRVRFGLFQGTDRRPFLFQKLQNLVAEARAARFCRSLLVSSRADTRQKNPRNFAVFAEGPLDEIRNLEADISQYLGRLEQPSAA